MEANKAGVIVMAFVVLIIALMLTPIIADYTTDATSTHNIINESITITTGAGQLNTNNLPIVSVTTIANETNSSDVTAQGWSLTNGTTFNISLTTGVITVDADQIWTGAYNVTYIYEGDSYVNDSSSRAILRLLPLFFVLGILGIALYWMYRMGLLDVIQGK